MRLVTFLVAADIEHEAVRHRSKILMDPVSCQDVWPMPWASWVIRSSIRMDKPDIRRP